MCYIHMNGATEQVKTQDQWVAYYANDEVTSGASGDSERAGKGTTLASDALDRIDEFDVDSFCQVHMGCTLLQIMQAKGHVVPGGLLHILIFVKGNPAHKKFLQVCMSLGQWPVVALQI